ncbi:hypothetical protein HaLaN_24669 [Haematococcus lacustris]|uniref:Uncharacterized protein n=1 Tax=Haematococcus lacustris TaxID=44745 RepID=A0A699ZWZ2_HAELA|nr:hypothetical protein HaLaN_24669 [Haematococcus lacustris]
MMHNTNSPTNNVPSPHAMVSHSYSHAPMQHVVCPYLDLILYHSIRAHPSPRPAQFKRPTSANVNIAPKRQVHNLVMPPWLKTPYLHSCNSSACHTLTHSTCRVHPWHWLQPTVGNQGGPICDVVALWPPLRYNMRHLIANDVPSFPAGSHHPYRPASKRDDEDGMQDEPYLQSPSWRRRLCDLDKDLEDDLDMQTTSKPKPYVGHVDNNVHRHQPTREVRELHCPVNLNVHNVSGFGAATFHDERYLVSAARRRLVANLNKDGKDALDTQDEPAFPSSDGRRCLIRSNANIGDDLAKQVTQPLRHHNAPSSSHRPSCMYCLLRHTNQCFQQPSMSKQAHTSMHHVPYTSTNIPNHDPYPYHHRNLCDISAAHCLSASMLTRGQPSICQPFVPHAFLPRHPYDHPHVMLPQFMVPLVQDHAHLLSGARRRLLTNLNNSTQEEGDAQDEPVSPTSAGRRKLTRSNYNTEAEHEDLTPHPAKQNVLQAIHGMQHMPAADGLGPHDQPPQRRRLQRNDHASTSQTPEDNAIVLDSDPDSDASVIPRRRHAAPQPSPVCLLIHPTAQPTARVDSTSSDSDDSTSPPKTAPVPTVTTTISSVQADKDTGRNGVHWDHPRSCSSHA